MKLNLTKEAVDWFFSRDYSEYSPFADMDKARKICNMRLGGCTYPQIADGVGLSVDRARVYVVKVQCAYERMLKCEEYQKRQQNNSDKLKDIFKLIEIEYDHAQKCNYIRKPLAYALHEVWRKVDRKEKERDVN